MMRICSAAHPHLSPTNRTRSPGGQKLTLDKPSLGTPTQPSYLTSRMTSSDNQAGRPPPDASHVPIAAPQKRSAVPQRPCGEYQPTGGGPWGAARPVRQRDVGWSSTGRPGRIIESSRYASFRPVLTQPRPPYPGRGCGPPPTKATPGRIRSPIPSAYPRAGPPHPREPSGNGPRGLQRARMGSPWYPETLPPTEAAAGGRVNHGGLAGEIRRLAASPGFTRLMPGCKMSRGERMKVRTLMWRLLAKTHVVKNRVSCFPCILVLRLSPLPVFDVLPVFCKRGTRNTGFVWLSP